MANNSTDIRRLMTLMESAQEPVLLEGWLSNLKNKKIKKLGAKERASMADRLKQEWLKWLGQTGREGTESDMNRFMKIRIGFTDEDAMEVMTKAFPETDSETEQETEKTIARGQPEPEAKQEPEWDPEEGVPLPKDLDTKLSDFAKYGVEVEKNDNKTEAGEVVDDPRKYRTSNGEWDRKKISDKLAKMPMGDKLTLGTSTFFRSVGAKPDAEKSKVAAESIMEAEADADVLDNAEVDAIMDASAARINDHYLLNGPRNDQDDMAADAAAKGLAGKGTRTTVSSPNKPGKASSGQYDAAEMFAILKTDFEKGPSWVNSVTRKVMQADSISKMSDSDMQDLALLGWALVRARN